MSILNATWLTPTATLELQEMKKNDVDSFNFLERQYQTWPSPNQPTKFWLYHIC